jgi:RHS repeat-associated protein
VEDNLAPKFALGTLRSAGARKRRTSPLLALVVVTLATALVSVAPAAANTEVKSNVTTNTTWTPSGSPYDLDTAVTVTAGATLTIEPGVTVDFNHGTTAALNVQGTIKALGSPSSHVIFTSHQALSGGGEPGQYMGVKVSSGNAASHFSYSDFFYGAYGSAYYGYAVLTASKASTVVTVDHSVFENNLDSAIQVGTLESATAIVSYSRFANNGDGLSTGGPGVLNVSHSTVTKNLVDGVHLNLTNVGSVFTYDTITENGSAGISIGSSHEKPASSYAHGEYNNIYANGPAHEGANQLYVSVPLQESPIAADWRNNYWGPEVYFYFNDKRCAETATPFEGHLAESWSKPAHSYQVPVGPITSKAPLYSEKVEKSTLYYECGWDLFHIGPSEFFTSPVPNAGASPGSGSPEPTAPVFYGGGTSEAAPNLNTASCGDPVNCVTGDFFETYRDLAIPGLNGGLSLSRTYNSQAAAGGSHGPFGYGWSSTFGQTLALDPSGEAATVTNADGSVVVFTKNAEGAFTAPAWVQATLVQSGENLVYTLPNQRAYTFSAAGRLLKVVDRNGNTTSLNYNEAGRLETVTDPGGRKLAIAYNGEGLIESVKDPMGHAVKYAYEGGNLASVTEPGESSPRWRYSYDSSHEITTVTDGRGGETVNEYDASRRVVSQTDPLKRKTTWAYEAGDTRVSAPTSVTDVQFAGNLPTQITRAYGTESAASTKYEYDSNDNVVKVTDANGHATQYEYDGEGNRIKALDADEDTTKWTYDTKHDVLSVTTPKGETTTIKRDAHGNAEAIERPAPAGKTQISKYKYDSHGDLEQVTDPLERIWKYEYDGYGDRTAAVDPEGDKRTYKYDEDSHTTSNVSPRGNLEGAEASKYTSKLELDARERPIKVTDPLGHELKYVYDANGDIEKLTDPNGHTTTYTHDADGELTKVEAPNGTSTETGYDEAGRVVSQTDGNKHTTKYVRNQLGEVVEVVDPLGRKTTKEYAKAGNLTGITDAAKRTSTYKYDPAGRLSEVSYSDGETPGVKYEYDADGERTKMVDGTGTSKYTYDQLDRLIESKDGHGNVVGYEYDLANEQTKITYPGSKAVTRAYDKTGRLESTTDWLEHTTKFAHDADSDLTATVWPSGSGEEDKYAFNEADELMKVEMNKGAESLASLTYTRDNNGQLKTAAQTGLPGEAETSYSYDEANRLTKAGSPAYEYDAANNLTKTGSSTGEYDSADELTKAASVSYSYDELGERTKATPGTGPATTYGYDQAGDLTSLTRPHEGEVAAIEDSYGYDGNGLRASQTISGSTKYMTWDHSRGLPLLLGDGTYSFIYGPQGLPIEQIAGEGVLYLHHDQQGSTRMLSSASGAVEGTASYGAYGTLSASTGTASSPLGYDGQYTNLDTGLQYLRARAYDPSTAQFMSADPLAAVTRSPYGYTGQDPLSYGDPSGLCSLNPFSGGNCYEDAAEAVTEGAEGAGNVLAGAADTLTGGLSTEALDAIGIEPDTCSATFQVGKYLGYAGVVIPGVGDIEGGEEALALERALQGGGRAPELSSPYGVHTILDDAGNIKQVTTYDVYGRRAYQYDIGPNVRHGAGYHRFDYGPGSERGERLEHTEY